MPNLIEGPPPMCHGPCQNTLCYVFPMLHGLMCWHPCVDVSTLLLNHLVASSLCMNPSSNCSKWTQLTSTIPVEAHWLWSGPDDLLHGHLSTLSSSHTSTCPLTISFLVHFYVSLLDSLPMNMGKWEHSLLVECVLSQWQGVQAFLRARILHTCSTQLSRRIEAVNPFHFSNYNYFIIVS